MSRTTRKKPRKTLLFTLRPHERLSVDRKTTVKVEVPRDVGVRRVRT